MSCLQQGSFGEIRTNVRVGRTADLLLIVLLLDSAVSALQGT
jgi:hypothetical protein